MENIKNANINTVNQQNNVIHIDTAKPLHYRWRDKLLKSQLPPNARFIGLVLISYMNNSTTFAFPSLRTLKQQTGLSINTIRTHLKTLVDENYLSLVRHYAEQTNRLKHIYHLKLSTEKRQNIVKPVSTIDTVSTKKQVQNTTYDCINHCQGVYQPLILNNQENNQRKDIKKTYKKDCVYKTDSQVDLFNSESYPQPRTENDLTKQKKTFVLPGLAKKNNLANTREHENRFNEFWKAYPRKVAKDAAKQRFFKINPDVDLFEKIMMALTNFKNANWSNLESRYIPHAATWLNGKRWDDEIEFVNPKSKQAYSPRRCLSLAEQIQERATLDNLGIDSKHGVTYDANSTDETNHDDIMAIHGLDLWAPMDS